MRGTVSASVWQRNYWEHVIRNQEAFNRIRDYILTNPKRWHLDRENPNCTGEDDFDRWLSGGAGL
jgi:putative transposase